MFWSGFFLGVITAVFAAVAFTPPPPGLADIPQCQNALNSDSFEYATGQILDHEKE